MPEAKPEAVNWVRIKRALLGRLLNYYFCYDASNVKRRRNKLCFYCQESLSKQYLLTHWS